jgi:serine/threonine-protein kinase
VNVPEKAAKASILVPGLKKSAEADKGGAVAAPPPDPSRSSAPPPPEGQLVTPQAPQPDRAGNGQRTAAYVVGGAGIVGLGIGSIFGLQAMSKNKDAETHCPMGYVCKDAQGPALADDARSAARVSTIVFAIGGAALVGGAVLFFTSNRQQGSVTYAVGPTGVTVGGSFQ